MAAVVLDCLYYSIYGRDSIKRNNRMHLDSMRNSYACECLGLKNQFSSHGYRRTALTRLHKNNVPLKVIMTISGHTSLGALQRYIDVDDEEVVEAVRKLW